MRCYTQVHHKVCRVCRREPQGAGRISWSWLGCGPSHYTGEMSVLTMEQTRKLLGERISGGDGWKHSQTYFPAFWTEWFQNPKNIFAPVLQVGAHNTGAKPTLCISRPWNLNKVRPILHQLWGPEPGWSNDLATWGIQQSVATQSVLRKKKTD